MRVGTFVGFVALFALIGLCVVQETNRQYHARSRLGLLQKREENQLGRIKELDTRIARLCETRRLDQLNRSLDLGLRPLRPPPAESRP